MNHKSELKDVILLALGLALFYALWLGSHAVLTPDEARYSEIARAMAVSGDYITPRINGAVFLDKPILYFWLQALAIKFFGLHEWALRLWPVTIGISGCLFTYVAGRRLFNRRAGLLAAVILATAPLYFGMSHYANLDLEVAVFITVALLAFCIAMRPETLKKDYWLLAAYGSAGLAVLAKGLIGIVLPALIAGAWVLYLRNWRLIKTMRLLSGLALVILIALPWVVLMQKAHPEFIRHFFWEQQLERFVSHDFNNQQPPWFYLPIILAGLFPWIGFLPVAIVEQIKLIRKNKQEQQIPCFLLIWPLVILVFFSLPHSKTMGYILPALPPLALLIGKYIDAYWDVRSRLKIVFFGLALITIMLELAAAATVKYFDLPSVKPLAVMINQAGQPADEVAVYHKYWYDLPLYTQRRVTVVADWDNPDLLEGDNWRREVSNNFYTPQVRQWLITENVFWPRWRSDKRIFILVDQRYVARFEKAAQVFYRLGRYQDVILYSNKPA